MVSCCPRDAWLMTDAIAATSSSNFAATRKRMRLYFVYRFQPKARARQIFASVLALTLSSTHAAFAACPAGTAPDANGSCVALRSSYADQMYLGAPIAQGQTIVAPSEDLEPLPFVVGPSGDSVSFRAGLSTLRDYNAKKLQKQIESAKATAGANVKLPQALPAEKPTLDVWSSVVAPDTAWGQSNAMRSSVGADYKMTPSTTTGIVAERADPVANAGALATAARDEKLSAYVNFKAAPILSFDAKTEWQRTDTPGAEGSTATETSKISFAPKLQKKYDLKDGNTVEPYATVRHDIDLNVAPAGKGAGDNAVGAGVTFAKPDSYSMTLSTDLENLGGTDPSTTSTKLQFKMPLP